jgi:hypothetical protein
MAHQLEARVVGQMSNVGAFAAKKIVKAYDLVIFPQQPLA